ncbi:hypothetical protein O181_045447 [Austropuccinia psidii MF-1]|uniref:Uncharacterized protein n=1 Tax=Austropuccinia psidii MF-1 TaxID=1389203 RepID=A0A9Q3DPE8_9BASI|nr:hypothetical protein [Austropuccinia psidii MF-1]
MPIQHSPPARPTRSQTRAQAVLTPTTRAPLYGTPAFATHPSRIDSLQELMDVILELDTSNDFSSAKSYAALVGDSRTPSFPSSVHIPSLNSHQSLLSSRDKVFKEIQDVGEHNSVSSLHLFFGNMDLPPSSYHDSLEELCDEEEEPEEIETVMKVVTSVNHQY